MRRLNKKLAICISAIMMLGLVGCGGSKTSEKSDDRKIDYVESTVAPSENIGMTEMYEEEACEAVEGVMKDAAGITNDGDIFIEEPDFNTNEFNNVQENSWCDVNTSPLSTFAADVDTASYAELRSFIKNGYDIDSSMVRLEEMINYFHYDYEKPKAGEKFAVHTEYADCPWNEQTKLAMIALSTESIDFSESPDSNLVFLIDTSGSMFDADKLPLIQQSLNMLVENLSEKDRISIVTYAGSETVVLEGVSGDQHHRIVSAIEELEAHGSTNGSAGINKAYELAEKYFIKGGNNRVILATDGDLNVGLTSEGELERLITEKKKSGVFLSVFGVGYGNLKDNKMETLADKGNGNYAYLDSIFEAKKALVDELGANMVTVAKDVKLQVEFNPNQVKGYRLLGYENRVMAAQDFADDTKDGGEMGAGHTVTALYEIVPADSDFEMQNIELKYTEMETRPANTSLNNELFTVNVRYKEVDEDESKLNSYVCTRDDYSRDGSDNLRWAAAVAGFGMLLKDSEYMGTTDRKLILELADSVEEIDDARQEFIGLVSIANVGK